MVKRFSGKIFDDNGHLIDKDTEEKLKKFLNSFDEWII